MAADALSEVCPASAGSGAEPQIGAQAGNLIDRFVVHELDQRGISMRQVRQAVEQPPAQMPQGKGAQQQGCHCQGLDGPRGAQSGLLDDRGGSSCAHRLIHDEPGALCGAYCSRGLRHPGGVLQRTAQPGVALWQETGVEPAAEVAGGLGGRPRSRTATPRHHRQNDSTSSESRSATSAASATASAAATATWILL